jgi:hypothetical protein
VGAVGVMMVIVMKQKHDDDDVHGEGHDDRA